MSDPRPTPPSPAASGSRRRLARLAASFPARPCVLLAVLFTALSPALLPAPRARAEQWVEVRSPHFQVISNASEKRARRVAGEFEEIRRAVTLWFPGLEHNPAPIRIFALETMDQIVGFTEGAIERRRYVAGLFRSHPLGDELLLGLNVDTQHSYAVLYHEYFHSVTRHSLPGLPLWLNEGMAEILANTILFDRRMEIGLANKGYLRLIGDVRLVSLEEILDPDTAAMRYTAPTSREVFYALSWALTHYFLIGNDGQEWPKLMRYLDACAQGADEEAAWNEYLGSRQEVATRLWKYLNRGRFPKRTLEASVEVDGEAFAARKLSQPEVDALRGTFLTRGVNPDAAETLLGAAIAADDQLALAHETLGTVRYLAGDWPAARGHLERALELDADRHVAHYQLALLEKDEKAEGWPERAVEQLRLAQQAAPWFDPAYAELARHYAENGGSLVAATVLARKAAVLGRGDIANHLLLARLLAEQGEHGEAAAEARFAAHLAITSASAGANNQVCWQGALSGLAREVVHACDAAVARDPQAGAYRDSRAVARATLGDLAGAADDLRLFLSSEMGKDEAYSQLRKRREGWLEELEAGINPIDDEELAQLRREEL